MPQRLYPAGGEKAFCATKWKNGNVKGNSMTTSLTLLEQRFKAMYNSYRLLRGRQDAALSWKRAWLDVKREIRKDTKPDSVDQAWEDSMESGKIKRSIQEAMQRKAQEVQIDYFSEAKACDALKADYDRLVPQSSAS